MLVSSLVFLVVVAIIVQLLSKPKAGATPPTPPTPPPVPPTPLQYSNVNFAGGRVGPLSSGPSSATSEPVNDIMPTTGSIQFEMINVPNIPGESDIENVQTIVFTTAGYDWVAQTGRYSFFVNGSPPASAVRTVVGAVTTFKITGFFKYARITLDLNSTGFTVPLSTANDLVFKLSNEIL